VASTCSPPTALVSICCGSGGGGLGSVTSSFSGGGSCALSTSGCSTGDSGPGVAETGSSSFNPKADVVLTMQNQIYHQTSRTEQKIHYAQGAALTERISSCRTSSVSVPVVLQPRYSLPVAGSHQPRARDVSARCPPWQRLQPLQK
jgi:hypothetical protein